MCQRCFLAISLFRFPFFVNYLRNVILWLKTKFNRCSRELKYFKYYTEKLVYIWYSARCKLQPVYYYVCVCVFVVRETPKEPEQEEETRPEDSSQEVVG